MEHPLLGADETDLDPARPEQLEEPGVGGGVGHDEIRCSKRAPVDRAERSRGEPARTESPAVLDQRVPERDERVEDNRAAVGCSPRGAEVEMPRVADDHRIERLTRWTPQPHLRRSEPQSRARSRRELVLPAFPDRDVPFGHLDAGPT